PISGGVTPAYVKGRTDGVTTVWLALDSYDSRVLIFSKPAPGDESIGIKTAVSKYVDMSNGWRVSFGPGGKTVQMDKLRSWTDNEATRYFSGTATYERE